MLMPWDLHHHFVENLQLTNALARIMYSIVFSNQDCCPRISDAFRFYSRSIVTAISAEQIEGQAKTTTIYLLHPKMH